MTPYPKIPTAVLFFSVLILSSCSGKKETEETSEAEDLPNIVLLMGDDHGWDETGYNGHPYVKTPVLDQMATQGLRFDRFHSGHPSCSPTRGSFITGRHPNRYGTFSPGWSVRPEEISIAHIVKKAGYATAHFGKWHLGPVKKSSPTNPGAMGFDEWLSHDNFFEMDPVLSRNGGPPEGFEGEGSRVIIDEAIKFIDKAKAAKKPFLVLVWFGSPHEPYSGLKKDLELYADLPESLEERTVRLTSNETGRRVERPLRQVLQERYAEITAMDRSIGVLRNHLKAEKLDKNTLLWYCGDNGTPPSADRVGMTIRAQKGSVYQGGILVPGVLEWPARISKGRATGVPAVTSDFLPTLCALTGQPQPDRPLDGINLVPVIEGTTDTRPQPIFFWKLETGQVFENDPRPYIDPELQEGTTPLVKMMAGKYTRSFRNYHYTEVSEADFTGARAMMDNRYKLVVGTQNGGEESVELYDLIEDRAEQNDLAGQYPEVVKDMKQRMHDWQGSVLESLTGADY